MNLKECYEKMGGSYEEIMHLLLNEQRVIRYLDQFKKDPSMSSLQTALKQKQFEEAFQYAHTLKGVSINLAMTRLASSSSALTEELRNGNTDVEAYVARVQRDYDDTISAINAFAVCQ